MVGIAGRSQGCHTCRKRRVKCDAEKPVCKRCCIAGIPCEGYERGRIFLNRTANGFMRRKPFEEVLRSSHAAETPAFKDESELGPQISQNVVVTTRLESLFLEKFLVSNASSVWPSPGTYIYEVFYNLPRDWVLQPAIQALCSAKIGRLYKDKRLVEQAKEAYLLALKRLCVNVTRADRVGSDSTFAATKILNLYEVYEPTDDSKEGLFNHAAGLLSLLQSRRRDGCVSKAVQLILQASRYNLMISCIQRAQYSDSALVMMDRSSRSFTTITDIEQCLIDIGFDVGNFIHDIRCLVYVQSIPWSVVEQTARKCLSIHQSLRAWYAQLNEWYSYPLWIEIVGDGNLEYTHIAIGHALLDYWAISLVLNSLLEKTSAILCSKLDRQQTLEGSYLQGLSGLARGANAESRIYARNIARSIDYCCQPEMGFIGPQRTMFANCILVAFWRSRLIAKDEVVQTIETLKLLQKRNGLHFASDIGDPTLPEWAVPYESTLMTKAVTDSHSIN